jgi:CheY-like chemotaxis protein
MAKILIIEDDPLINKMYSEKLARDGYEVSVAANGKIGLEEMKANRPDLIILDIMMPEMSGTEVITQMKQDQNLEKIPIIVLSNLTEGPDIEAAKKMGIAEYLIKSNLDPEDVSRTIKKYLK